MENNNTGLNGPKKTNLCPGDFDEFYAGAINPKPVRRPLYDDAFTSDNPEDIMIAKERWQTVNLILTESESHGIYVDWVLDHLAGYSFAEIAQRHKTTKSSAQYRVELALAYLQSKTKNTEF